VGNANGRDGGSTGAALAQRSRLRRPVA
jgi:hypothetical protein